MTALLLALQPACAMYTRSVMESAAAETARAALTAGPEDARAVRDFALRRLAAVPDLEVFHAGGPLAWEVEATADGREVRVRIAGAIRPLPVIGAFAAAMGATNAHGDVPMEAEVSCQGRPAWLEGSYGDWVEMWE